MTEKLANLLQNRLAPDAVAFLPELILCGTIVMLLVIRLIPRYDRLHLGWVALLAAALACYLAIGQWLDLAGLRSPTVLLTDALANLLKDTFLDGVFIRSDSLQLGDPTALPAFGGMLLSDAFGVFIKIFLCGFLTLVVVLTMLTGIPDREDSADFYVLLFGATLGMSLMAASNHLLMVFLSIEMASLPSYALAGFLKGRRQSSEAALKYVVYGGGASGVMLYGISLLAGKFDTGYLPDILAGITATNSLGSSNLSDAVVVMGITFVLAGIGFKLASVPFHFWCPDVFEGAAAEVGAFLSVASKGAALALLARIALGLAGLSGVPGQVTAWYKATDYLVPILSVIAVATTTFGNLAAFGQTNLKRLLAYSTIAHAGFMMMGLATLTRDGAGAVLFYLVIYLFMNLGAFAVVAMMRNLTGQEDLAYYRGFVFRSPLLVIALGAFLLSLLGLPPLAGFMAKFQIFAVLFDAAEMYSRPEVDKPGLSWTLYAVLVAGGLNTVISLFYYVKVLKVMVLEKTLEEVEDREVEQKPAPVSQGIFVATLATIVLGLGIYWNPLAVASSRQGVESFRAAPPGPAPAPIPPPGSPGPQKGAK